MNNYPVIKFILLFISGIILQNILYIHYSTLLIILSVSMASLLILLFSEKQSNQSLKTLFIFILVVSFGAVSYIRPGDNGVRYSFKEPYYREAVICGRIAGIDLVREGRLITYINADSVITFDGIYTGKIKILSSISEEKRIIDSIYERIHTGNKMVLKGILKRPRDQRNPGEFDYEKYLNAQGISAIISVYDVKNYKVKSAEISFLPDLIFRIRRSIDNRISLLQNNTTASFLRGLLLADRSMIDPQINDFFINSGVVHVLSVSGLHVGYIVLIFLFLFNRFNIYARFIITAAGLFSYLVLTGGDSPVARSTIMALVLMVAPIIGRNYNSLNAIALSAFIILLICPNELFNPSFQLSFSAMLSLVLLYPPLAKEALKIKINNRVFNYILMFCVSTFAAQLGTLPFTLIYFHRLSITAFLANMIVIPLSGAIVGLGILALIISLISIWLAAVFASANNLLTFLLFHCIKILGNPELSFIRINQFSVFGGIVFYSGLTIFVFVIKKFRNIRAKTVAILFLAASVLTFIRADRKELLPGNLMSIMMIDIGQGNACLIKFPNGKSALFDAGSASSFFDNGEKVIAPFLSNQNIDKIDYAFLSHIDTDHSGGFISLIKNNKIGRLYKPKIDSTSNRDLEFEELLRNNRVRFDYYCKEKVAIGNVSVYVLNDTFESCPQYRDANDRSGIIKVVYGNTSILFTGDASSKIEDKYLDQYGSFLKSDILMVAHHGSRKSTCDRFLNKVDPEIALISCGIGNRFHHPHEETLQRINSRHIEIERTDLSGAELLVSDGKKIKKFDWKANEELMMN